MDEDDGGWRDGLSRKCLYLSSPDSAHPGWLYPSPATELVPKHFQEPALLPLFSFHQQVPKTLWLCLSRLPISSLTLMRIC